MQGWFRDIRYAVRQLLKTPVFTLIAVVTLALGIGANSTVYSWIDSTLFSPVPGAHPAGQLVAMTRGKDPLISYPDYLDLRHHTRSLSGLLGWNNNAVTLSGLGTTQRLWAALTTENYFDVLGVRPVLGRFFQPREGQVPGEAAVAVLAHRTWQTVFDGDPAIIGRTIYLNKHPYTVIGVAPPRFQGSSTGLRMDIWAPFMMTEALTSNRDSIRDRGDASLALLGVLAPGVTRAQAQQELTAEMKQIAGTWPSEHTGPREIVTYPMWRAPYGANAYLYVLLPTLMAIALAVLLLACVNVANLFLVRDVARRREMAIRLSLGATRMRLICQLLIESVLVGLAGGLLALVATLWSARSFDRFLPPTDVPIAFYMHVDNRVLAVTFLLSILTGITFGLLPALRSSRIVPAAVLKEEAGATSSGLHKARVTSTLVAVQIALSFLLLVCGGLFVRAYRDAQGADPGFRADHVLLSSIDLFPAGYGAESGITFQRELLRRIEQIPGVRSASFSDWSPLGLRSSDAVIIPEGYAPQHNESLDMAEMQVGPSYLRTLGMRLIAGRDIQASDTPDTRLVAVVNQRFSRMYWPGQDPIGHRVKIGGEWFTVVGVAGNSKYSDLDEAPQPFVFWPALQRYQHYMVLHVRVAGDPKRYAAPVAAAIHSLNAGILVLDQFPLTRNVEFASTGARVAGAFVGMLGMVGVTLAAIGIYGVIAYTTRQRRHEIGIRMAVGARRRHVFGLIVQQGLRLAAIGIAGGVLCSLVCVPFLRSQLYGVTPNNLPIYLGVAVIMSLVALGASFLPALLAALVDPIRALRYK